MLGVIIFFKNLGKSAFSFPLECKNSEKSVKINISSILSSSNESKNFKTDIYIEQNIFIFFILTVIVCKSNNLL